MPERITDEDLPLTDFEAVLTTTRSVRRRLDLDRPVDRQVVLDCLALATQAPSGGDAEDWPGEQVAPLPLFVPSEPKLRVVLLVTTMCCINETVACNVLEGQMRVTKSPLVRARGCQRCRCPSARRLPLPTRRRRRSA